MTDVTHPDVGDATRVPIESEVSRRHRPDITNTTGPTLMHRKFVIQEAIQHLSVIELEAITLLSKFHSDVVKEHLTVRLKNLLKKHLVRGNFVRVMKRHNVVISGSSVFEFMDPAFVGSWDNLNVGFKDLDLYVKKGHIIAVARYICGQKGIHSEVVFSSHERIKGTTWEPGEPDEEYDTNGIKSVIKIKLVRGSITRHVDIIESTCNSPILPIFHFDLSICRNALTVDGLAVYHADWTFKNISYLCPMVTNPVSSASIAHMKMKSEARTEKYAKRGVMIYHDLSVSTRAGSHTCTASHSCPQTLRNTEDSGVYFLPFSSMSDEDKQRCKSARGVTIMWRCGGPSCKGEPGGMNACVFRAPDLHKKFQDSSRI